MLLIFCISFGLIVACLIFAGGVVCMLYCWLLGCGCLVVCCFGVISDFSVCSLYGWLRVICYLVGCFVCCCALGVCLVTICLLI